jgi:hypothetical protein
MSGPKEQVLRFEYSIILMTSAIFREEGELLSYKSAPILIVISQAKAGTPLG